MAIACPDCVPGESCATCHGSGIVDPMRAGTPPNHCDEQIRDLTARLSAAEQDREELRGTVREFAFRINAMKDQIAQAVEFLDLIKVWGDWHARGRRLREILTGESEPVVKK